MPHPLNSKAQSLLSYLLLHHRVDQKGLFQQKNTSENSTLSAYVRKAETRGIPTLSSWYSNDILWADFCFFPQKFICWSSNHTQNVTEVGGRACKEVSKVKNGVIRVGPTPIGLLFYWEEETGTQTGIEKGPCEDTARRGPSTTEDRGLRRSQPCCHLDLGLQPPGLWENTLLFFMPPSVWFFVLAALAD